MGKPEPSKPDGTGRPVSDGAGGDLRPQQWYWVRKRHGVIAPYLFHRRKKDARTGNWVGEFYVGSTLVTFPLNAVIGEAQLPNTQGPNTQGPDCQK